jgi:prepilin-type N-terminal cleavage/methylation domain-containing protein
MSKHKRKMQYQSKTLKGFTLIELLMVIAIIGILASIILVNLNSAETKANDMAAFSMMRSIQAAANVCRQAGGAVGYFRTQSICSNDASFGAWPTTLATGWINGSTTGFNSQTYLTYYLWCDALRSLSSFSATNPPSVYPSGDNCYPGGNGGQTNCGNGSVSGGYSGNFCFYAKNTGSTKYVVCTEEGCESIGF